MELLALRAADRMLFSVYQTLAEKNDPQARDLGDQTDKLFLIWWHNVLSPEQKEILK